MNNKNKLFEKAIKCRNNAYAPYSGFQVGCAILSSSGKVYVGCNVENAAYPSGSCAEAGAISALIADGERKISEILVVADTKCILPCGNCLQKICEFSDNNTIIHSADLQGVVKSFKLTELLPNSFKAEDMKNA